MNGESKAPPPELVRIVRALAVQAAREDDAAERIRDTGGDRR